MPLPEQTISLRVPKGETTDAFLVRLADGQVVARTRAELLALPAELRTDLPPAPAEGEVE